MFPGIDDLPLSVSIESPNKFQIYQNLFPDRAGDHLAWLAHNVGIRLPPNVRKVIGQGRPWLADHLTIWQPLD